MQADPESHEVREPPSQRPGEKQETVLPGTEAEQHLNFFLTCHASATTTKGVFTITVSRPTVSKELTEQQGNKAVAGGGRVHSQRYCHHTCCSTAIFSEANRTATYRNKNDSHITYRGASFGRSQVNHDFKKRSWKTSNRLYITNVWIKARVTNFFL
jgi:hypothetical protein